MAVINIGSMNIDNVYSVEHFVTPGETLHASRLEVHAGGKGLNQSLALAKAGLEVKHAGLIGDGGAFLKKVLSDNSVDVSQVQTIEGPNGHAVIQVQPDGQNSIVLHGGTNLQFDPSFIEAILDSAAPDDVILLQNEINDIAHIIEQAKARGLRIVFNAAPCTTAVKDYPLHMLDLLIINEVEGGMLSGHTDPNLILSTLREAYPETGIVLTLGPGGVYYADKDTVLRVPACNVSNIVDTTSAGDTFTGYMMHEWLNGTAIERCLEIACAASAICIQRSGSSTSIPYRSEVPMLCLEPEAALA